VEEKMNYNVLHSNFELRAISREQLKGVWGKMAIAILVYYFLLGLSFFGWTLLGILTLGIGYLWLTPYTSLSVGNFYENLKKYQEEAIAEDKRLDAGQNLA
jgi:uncharacterized membrane protein